MENQLPVSPDSNDTAPSTVLSSGLTLFWRVFIPVFGTVFLSGLTLAFWLINAEDLDAMRFPAFWIRLLVSLLLAGWLWFVWRSLWRLKRVDANDTHFFVSNYWSTVRYPFRDISAVTESRRLGRRILHIRLKAPGRFGQVISFLPGGRADEWLGRWKGDGG